jgi:hypothetical protein
MLHRRSIAALCAVLPTTVVPACSDSTNESAIQRTDSAGVEIVTHTGPDTPLDWTFAAAFTLGGKDTEEESFYEADPTTIGVDGQEHIYLLDRDAYRVVVFDGDGRYVRSMGAEGGGPGEMKFPITITVAPDGSVDVFDIAKSGFVRFGPGGEILDERRVTVGLGTGTVRYVGRTQVVPIRDVDVDQGINRHALVTVDGADTTTVVNLERDIGGVVNLTSCGMRIMGVGPVFEPSLRWTPVGPAVAVASSAGYEIGVYRDGRLVQRLRRTVAPTPATPELAVASVGTGMKVMTPGGVRTCDANEVVEQRGMEDVIPVIGDLTEGPGGTLWVRRSTGPGAPHPIDVFEADGSYIGTLPDTAPFPAAVLGSRLIAVEADDMDVERLVIYDVEVRDS